MSDTEANTKAFQDELGDMIDVLKAILNTTTETDGLSPLEQTERVIAAIMVEKGGARVLAKMFTDHCRIMALMHAEVPEAKWDPILVMMRDLSLDTAREDAAYEIELTKVTAEEQKATPDPTSDAGTE